MSLSIFLKVIYKHVSLCGIGGGLSWLDITRMKFSATRNLDHDPPRMVLFWGYSVSEVLTVRVFPTTCGRDLHLLKKRL